MKDLITRLGSALPDAFRVLFMPWLLDDVMFKMKIILGFF